MAVYDVPFSTGAKPGFILLQPVSRRVITSDWDDWFVSEEIEATDIDGVTLWFLGCNGFVIRSSDTTIYIDPYFGTGDPPRTVRMVPVPMHPGDATECDAVLATHEHVDHLHPPSYEPLVTNCDANLYATETALAAPQYDSGRRVPATQRHPIVPGDAFDIGDFTVHVRDANDPDASGDVTYVIDHQAGTFFHAGDSRPAPETFPTIGAEFDIDLGALAFGSTGRIFDYEADEAMRRKWYMDEDEVIEAASQLELTRLMPTHSNMWRGMEAEPAALRAHAISHPFPRVVEQSRIGDRFSLHRPGRVPLRTVGSS